MKHPLIQAGQALGHEVGESLAANAGALSRGEKITAAAVLSVGTVAIAPGLAGAQTSQENGSAQAAAKFADKPFELLDGIFNGGPDGRAPGGTPLDIDPRTALEYEGNILGTASTQLTGWRAEGFKLTRGSNGRTKLQIRSASLPAVPNRLNSYVNRTGVELDRVEIQTKGKKGGWKKAATIDPSEPTAAHVGNEGVGPANVHVSVPAAVARQIAKARSTRARIVSEQRVAGNLRRQDGSMMNPQGVPRERPDAYRTVKRPASRR